MPGLRPSLSETKPNVIIPTTTVVYCVSKDATCHLSTWEMAVRYRPSSAIFGSADHLKRHKKHSLPAKPIAPTNDLFWLRSEFIQSGYRMARIVLTGDTTALAYPSEKSAAP